ncbi:hypothetical protein, partial [Mesorhizobium sp. M5C.F.Ca.ET.164.01.1.1]|uniref:hypothetical protein n=1 Tax=Mesorhizobium sp. M5C.F.Ca.ET.164.01.1.1 TaxID=2563957 RepID=UPI001AED919C
AAGDQHRSAFEIGKTRRWHHVFSPWPSRRASYPDKARGQGINVRFSSLCLTKRQITPAPDEGAG